MAARAQSFPPPAVSQVLGEVSISSWFFKRDLSDWNDNGRSVVYNYATLLQKMLRASFALRLVYGKSAPRAASAEKGLSIESPAETHKFHDIPSTARQLPEAVNWMDGVQSLWHSEAPHVSVIVPVDHKVGRELPWIHHMNHYVLSSRLFHTVSCLGLFFFFLETPVKKKKKKRNMMLDEICSAGEANCNTAI